MPGRFTSRASIIHENIVNIGCKNTLHVLYFQERRAADPRRRLNVIMVI